MTVIVYRDRVMAGDTLTTSGSGVRVGYCQKIARTRSGALVGVCGNASPCALFLEWATTARKGAKLRLEDEEFEALMAYPDGRVAYYYSDGTADFLTAEYHAIGTGREVAVGALDMGATAVRAVEAAIRHHTSCGGEVTELRMRGRAVRSGRQPGRR